ncbi:hypothetical protein BD414DRAFT_415353, partial [Trametes punicea]
DHHCIIYISKVNLCSRAPDAIHKEALVLLMENAGIEVHDTFELTEGTGSSQDDPVLINDENGEGALKKQKLALQGTTWVIGAYLDRLVLEKDKEKADMYHLRYIPTLLSHDKNVMLTIFHGGLAFRASEHPYLASFVQVLCSTYTPPTCYVLM